MTQEFPQLDEAMLALQTAMAERHGPAERLRRAQQGLDRANSNITDAVTAYNQLRINLLIDAKISQSEGWCMNGKHFVPEEMLLGMVQTGEGWRGSEYYEHIERYTNYFTICRTCAEKYGSQPRHSGGSEWSQRDLVPLDIRATWTTAVRKNPWEIRKHLGTMGLPAEISQGPWVKGPTQDGQAIEVAD